MKKKLFAAVALCIAALLGISGFTGCANNPSEVGNWKLSYFGDGESNYAVGDDYQGREVTENLYSSSFDGSSYKVYHNGAVIKEGGYSAENAGKNSVMLALNDGDGLLYWNLGTETQENGEESLRIVAELDGKTICFIPA